MKNLKIIAMSLCLAMSFISAGWAFEIPTACPSIDLIKKTGLSGVRTDDEYNMYIVYQLNKYNTPSYWAFFIAVPKDQATFSGDAKNKAKEALNTLSGNPVPMGVDDDEDGNKTWYCTYENQLKYPAIAMTPVGVSNQMVHTVFTLPKKK